MSSFNLDGKLEFQPVERKLDDVEEMFNYDLTHNTVWMEGRGEEYCPQVDFDWGEESVFVNPHDDTIVKYTREWFYLIPAVDADGNKLMVRGLGAPYEGGDLDENHKKIHYLDEERDVGFEYEMEVYDLKKKKLKRYKVVEAYEVDMNEWDIEKYCGQADAESAA